MEKFKKWFTLLLVVVSFITSTAPQVMATAAPATGYPSNSARTNAEMKQYFEDTLAVEKELPGGAPRAAVTIASGAFTLANNVSVVIITSETGTVDDLTNVTQSSVRDGRIMLMAAASGHTITIKNAAGGSGQFIMADSADLTLQSTQFHIFYYNGGSTRWEELKRDHTNLVLGGMARSTLTLDTNGYCVPTRACHLIDTFAAAASDNCDRLTTTNDIPFVLVRQANAGRVVTLRHNIGGDGSLNMADSKDLTFSSTSQAVLFELVGTTYNEVGRFGFLGSITEAKSATFTAEWGKTYVLSGASYTINLPTAVGNAGSEIKFIKTTNTSSGYALDGFSTQTVSGNATFQMVGALTTVIVTSDGTNVHACPSYEYGDTNNDCVLGWLSSQATQIKPTGLSYSTNGLNYNGIGGALGWDTNGNSLVMYPIAYAASAEQTITAGSAVTIAHGLGRLPYDYRVVLRCKTTEGGWAVGDEVIPYFSTSSANDGFSIGVGTSNITVCTSTNTPRIVPKAGGAGISITAANWRYVVYYR